MDLPFLFDEYIAFIKKWNVKQYIELDIDSVIGYDKVKEIRNKLEKETGVKSMPVFHNKYRTKKRPRWDNKKLWL